jgi:Fe2+-dicitrate sensor, membrane component
MEGIRELIFKYLDGELEESQVKDLLDWVNACPENKETLFSLKESYFALSYEQDRKKADSLKEWQKLSARIGIQVEEESVRKGRWRFAVGIAASLVVGILGGWLAFRPSDRMSDEAVAVTTGFGQHAEATLPDGSKVTLDPCSRLTYSFKDWNRQRNVSLSGEGVFEVVTHPDRPFTVRTGGFDVQVLGTVFKVSAYDNEKESSVILKSGVVRMKLDDTALKLSPGECCLFDNKTHSYRLVKASESDLFDWKSDELHFDGQELNEMTSRLYRHFGYTFVLTDDVKKMVYKATIRDESLQEFLEILEAVTPRLLTRIDKESRTVYLSLRK